ncbi:MAG: translation initiation factor IF-2 [Thermoguttaceae bacterium]|nr:translation initiation factor IF-2 [Thermoguttaceae bacterium]
MTLARVNDIVIETPCTVKDFSGATGVGVAVVIKELMKLGMMKTMNQTLDKETIELLIMSFNLKATVKEQATLEEQYVDAVINEADPPESLIPRAPVVTFLGHVDHGKTSLLDRILNLHVVSGEKGGITQHIRTYRIDTPGGAVTFVDTPGHEAFTEMRARGANCTDIAVLVVAADDGVMPQTEEAISHAKAAGVPIIVALNKMDLPGVKRDKVIQELANNDLTPSEWGGDVEIVETSAITGMGVDTLLDTILTVAELSELKANPDRAADGVVLEASLQSGEGVVCKALVQNGTLHNGDVVLCGASYGRVRSMTDTLDPHKRLKEAGPSVPVTLVGLDVAPEAGSRFIVLEDVSVARQIAEERAKRARAIELAGTPSHVTLENLFERMNSAKAQQTLNVIIRADVRGSIEAIRKEMSKLEHPEVKVKILQATVGGITEADVYLADASDAIIAGFNVVPDEGARALAETKKVQIRRYDIIYKLTEDIKAALEGMLRPIEQVKELGRALVQRTFNISRVGVIAGCRVLYGTIERDSQVRVIRDSRVIGEYALDTLRREKDDVKEVREGYECGIKLKNFNDVKEGDILEAYKIEEVARTF